MKSSRINFLEPPQEYTKLSDSQIVILPVPYDQTSTWIKGADLGPAAILEASANLEMFDIETDSEVYRKGIYTDVPIDSMLRPVDLVMKVEQKVKTHLDDNKLVVTLGGEHSVSIGAIQAHVAKYNDITVLQLDAHSDLRNQYNGSKYNHACVGARIKELCPLIQVGIRSMDSSEKQLLDKSRTFFAKDIQATTEWIDVISAKLSKQLYVTIDLDVFDPSIMPSTGTPEPGGLFWYQVTKLLRIISEHSKVVGFDVVELCPNPYNKAPDFLAAKLIYQFLSYIFKD